MRIGVIIEAHGKLGSGLLTVGARSEEWEMRLSTIACSILSLRARERRERGQKRGIKSSCQGHYQGSWSWDSCKSMLGMERNRCGALRRTIRCDCSIDRVIEWKIRGISKVLNYQSIKYGLEWGIGDSTIFTKIGLNIKEG